MLISRGLRPFARRYVRPPFGRVVRIDKAIYVGKVGSTSLMNPSASPVLESEEEARWLAAEMRRALQQTARRWTERTGRVHELHFAYDFKAAAMACSREART